MFASLLCYPLAKQHPDRLRTILAAMPTDSDVHEDWPAGFNTLQRARWIEDVQVHVDGSTLISPARSRSAGQFLESPHDVWLSFDDDIDADEASIAGLLEATRETKAVVLGGYRGRGHHSTFYLTPLDCPVVLAQNGHGGGVRVVSLPDPALLAHRRHGGRFPILQGGFGFAGVHREALERMVKQFPELAVDELFSGRQVTYPALFLEYIANRAWIGEDYAFCRRARASGVEVWGQIWPGVTHAGLRNADTDACAD